MHIYEIRVISYDDKGKKTIIEETVVAASYSHDEHNNLSFYGDYQEFIVEYHSYNYISFRIIRASEATKE